MAILKASNAALRSTEPSNKIDVSDQHARVRIMRDEITLTAELAAGDEVEFGAKLFKGAKIHEVILDAPILDTVATDIDVGYKYSDSALTSVPDAFLDGEDFVAAGISKMSDTQGLAGQDYEVEGDAQIALTLNTNPTDAGIGKKIKLKVLYSVD